MVRWVFRPYTQIWRPNCTLGALRTSTRVSPGFVLSKYSSPSFGSSSIYSGFRSIPTLRSASRTHGHRACSPAAPRALGNTDVSDQARAAGLRRGLGACIQFLCESFLVLILYLILAYKWDSLVRVSRRANLTYPHRLVSHPIQPPGGTLSISNVAALQSSDGSEQRLDGATPHEEVPHHLSFASPFSSIVSRLPSVSHTPGSHQHPPLWLRHQCPEVCFLVLDQITSISTTSNSFDSLFRVLFIFPSQYLFAIGFPSLFSLRWSIPPILSCTLKQLDSFTPSCLCCPATRYTLRESHPLCCRFPSDLVYPSPSIRRGL